MVPMDKATGCINNSVAISNYMPDGFPLIHAVPGIHIDSNHGLPKDADAIPFELPIQPLWTSVYV